MAPAGAPIALYHDWDGSKMAIDVGFPVEPAQAEMAEGEVKSGAMPSGKALNMPLA